MTTSPIFNEWLSCYMYGVSLFARIAAAPFASTSLEKAGSRAMSRAYSLEAEISRQTGVDAAMAKLRVAAINARAQALRGEDPEQPWSMVISAIRDLDAAFPEISAQMDNWSACDVDGRDEPIERLAHMKMVAGSDGRVCT
jgi:hypothetical protein